MLAVALLASAARGLVALRRTDLVAGALLPARAGPTKEQLGLLGVSRAAGLCCSSQPALPLRVTGSIAPVVVRSACLVVYRCGCGSRWRAAATAPCFSC